MKNKGLIIILLILLSVIVFFLCMFLVTCLTNGSKFGIGFINWGSKSKNVIMEKTYELSDINNIQIVRDIRGIRDIRGWKGTPCDKPADAREYQNLLEFGEGER